MQVQIQAKQNGAAFASGLKACAEGARNLDDVFGRLAPLLREQSKASRLGYVSGVITSDGKEHMPANLALLKRYTDVIRGWAVFPIFSATDIFDGQNEHRFIEPAKRWIGFWRDVLSAGVTDVFMTPRWEVSNGAKDEHAHSKAKNIKIHYVHTNPELLAILRAVRDTRK